MSPAMPTLLALILAAVTGISMAAAPQGSWVKSSYFSTFYPNGAGALDYSLYLPAGLQSDTRTSKPPLVVALHGCKEDGEKLDEISRLHELADIYGFALLYPEQSVFRNSDHCWNWFLPMNQGRGLGEAELIAGATAEIVDRYDLDAGRTYIVGFSSGGAMANIVASCYSDLFAAAAIHSGLEFLAASTIEDTDSVLLKGGVLSPEDSAQSAYDCSGEYGHKMPTIILHGSVDVRVAPVNSDQIFKQFQIFNDLLDDGKTNESVPHHPTHVSKEQPAGKYSYTVEDVEVDGQVLIRNITVDGMAHAWSGGAAGLPNSDPQGPDASRLIWDFISTK